MKHRYNPIEKECLALVFAVRRCDTILWGNAFMSSPELIPRIAHDKTIFTELQINEMGHIALTIRDAIHAKKAIKG